MEEQKFFQNTILILSAKKWKPIIKELLKNPKRKFYINSIKIKVFHFHNGGGGGVLSVICNLLRYSENKSIENHVIFTINKDLKSVYEMPVIEGAISRQVFYY